LINNIVEELSNVYNVRKIVLEEDEKCLPLTDIFIKTRTVSFITGKKYKEGKYKIFLEDKV